MDRLDLSWGKKKKKKRVKLDHNWYADTHRPWASEDPNSKVHESARPPPLPSPVLGSGGTPPGPVEMRGAPLGGSTQPGRSPRMWQPGCSQLAGLWHCTVKRLIALPLLNFLILILWICSFPRKVKGVF